MVAEVTSPVHRLRMELVPNLMPERRDTEMTQVQEVRIKM
jgi:hypothetical protein